MRARARAICWLEAWIDDWARATMANASARARWAGSPSSTTDTCPTRSRAIRLEVCGGGVIGWERVHPLPSRGTAPERAGAVRVQAVATDEWTGVRLSGERRPNPSRPQSYSREHLRTG